jgi:hypothetical protein
MKRIFFNVKTILHRKSNCADLSVRNNGIHLPEEVIKRFDA